MAKAKKTWIVIADGMRARVLQWEGGDRFARAVDEDLYAPGVHGHSRDLESDRPGRAFDTGSGARHAMEPHHDPHEYEKHVFARRVAKLINDRAAVKAFDRLVLVAPPKALGELRAALDAHAAKCVIGEIHRDLVHTPLHELGAHLREVLAA